VSLGRTSIFGIFYGAHVLEIDLLFQYIEMKRST
jgi:hypothetical protein